MNEAERYVFAYEQGLDDGFFEGNATPPEDPIERAFYKRGYEHGVWMFCEHQENLA